MAGFVTIRASCMGRVNYSGFRASTGPLAGWGLQQQQQRAVCVDVALHLESFVVCMHDSVGRDRQSNWLSAAAAGHNGGSGSEDDSCVCARQHSCETGQPCSSSNRHQSYGSDDTQQQLQQQE